MVSVPKFKGKVSRPSYFSPCPLEHPPKTLSYAQTVPLLVNPLLGLLLPYPPNQWYSMISLILPGKQEIEQGQDPQDMEENVSPGVPTHGDHLKRGDETARY